MTDTVQPRVLNDIKAGTALIDTNKYLYEYTLTYAESELVDYVLITQPEITHYSDSDRPAGLREEHVRMYWTGSYNKSMTELADVAGENGTGADGSIGWFDFREIGRPENYDKSNSLFQQTWETIGDHDAFQNNKSFVFTKTMGENGMEFIYLLEGTKTVNVSDGSFHDITGGIYDYLKNADAATVDKADRRYNNTYTSSGDLNTSANPEYNHRDLSHTGRPLGYGEHVNALIGIVFYNTVEFNANGGTFADDSVYTLHTYKDSKQAKAYVLHKDGSGNWVDGAVDVSNPTYGDVSVKAPSRLGYRFYGWYAAELDKNGEPVRYKNGSIVCSDIPVYDEDGKAVLTYTDRDGKTQASPYFDRNGRWIYKGNVTVAANWYGAVPPGKDDTGSEPDGIGTYSLRYDRGASNNAGMSMPSDGVNTVDSPITVADGSYIYGSDYTVDFKVYTNNGSQTAGVIQSVTGRFPYKHWDIEGVSHSGGDSYLKAGAINGTVITAAAVYRDCELPLPSTTSGGYSFMGWYRTYDPDTQTFSGYAGKAGDTLTIPASGDSVNVTLYARWEKADINLAFDYNIPSAALNSRLGYVITGDETESKTVQHGSPLGTLPSPALTGYKLNINTDESSRSDGWSTKPNRVDGTQVNVPVYSGTLYAGSYDTLYAQWEPVYYTIKYDLDGGSVSQENPTEYISYYKEITVYSPTRDGSTFLGWSITGMDGNRHIIDGKLTGTGLTQYSGVGVTKASDGTVTPRTSIKVTGLRADDGTVTLTAVWKDTDYRIAYDYRDAQSNAKLVPSSDPENPAAYTRNTPTFTLKNPEVKGYCSPLWGGTGITGTIPSVTIEQGSTGDRSYTAYFSPSEYEIIYDLSGGAWGTGAVHPDRAGYNRTFTVSHPVMNGCVFEGWEISGMCDDCTHSVGGSSVSGTSASGVNGTAFMNLRCDSSEKVRFTARWSHAGYDIRYELNGGDWPDNAAHPESAETYTSFDINNPVRSGCTFAGWTISGMDSGLHYLPSGDTYAESASSVGTGKADGMALTYGNLRYSSGTVTFKAAWVQDTRQVAFFGNGGTMTGDSVQDDWTLRFTRFGSTAFFEKYEYDAGWGTDVPAVSKTGHTFTGYYDALTGGNLTYDKNYSKAAGLYWDSLGRWTGPSLILYAQFMPNDYSVTFNVNGGCWASDSSQDDRVLGVTYDSTKNNKAYGRTDICRPGYTFQGWSTKADGTGDVLYDIDGYSTGGGGYWSDDYRKQPE